MIKPTRIFKQSFFFFRYTSVNNHRLYLWPKNLKISQCREIQYPRTPKNHWNQWNLLVNRVIYLLIVVVNVVVWCQQTMQRTINEFEKGYVCGLVYSEPLHFQNILPTMFHGFICSSCTMHSCMHGQEIGSMKLSNL